MEKRFENGEIRTYANFMSLLRTHAVHKARLKVLKEQNLFERALAFCLIQADKNLVHKKLDDILNNFLKETTVTVFF